jgi:hypothetical protein
LVKRHLRDSSSHHDYVAAAENYLRIQKGEDKSIVSKLSSGYDSAIAKNRHILKQILEVIVLCGQQNLPDTTYMTAISRHFCDSELR